jgi:vacuolar-type H+-ATPase subunit H
MEGEALSPDDLIDRLVATEDEASALVADAEKQAAEILNMAERKGREFYNENFTKASRETNEGLEAEIGRLKAESARRLDEYRAGIEGGKRNQAAFNTLARAVFFGGAG